MRVHAVGLPPAARLLLLTLGALAILGVESGMLAWAWTQAARLVCLQSPMTLSAHDAARATWRLIASGRWSAPRSAFPTSAERADAPGAWAYTTVAVSSGLIVCVGVRAARRRISPWRAGSPLGRDRGTLAAVAVNNGWVRQRTWANTSDLRRLWVAAPVSGRPYLGRAGRGGRQMLAAELEVQPMVIAPPRAGKSSGFVVPWLLDHDGPALVLSTKRDIYEASARGTANASGGSGSMTPSAMRDERRVHTADPRPNMVRRDPGRGGARLRRAPRPGECRERVLGQGGREHARAAAARLRARRAQAWASSCAGSTPGISSTRSPRSKSAGASAAADQLEGVGRRDERNRETTVMSALNLLRAYRYPQLNGERRRRRSPPRSSSTGERTRSMSSRPGTTRRSYAR